jgi:hypothetical protein
LTFCQGGGGTNAQLFRITMGTQSKLIPGLKEMSTEKLRDLFKGVF